MSNRAACFLLFGLATCLLDNGIEFKFKSLKPIEMTVKMVAAP